MGFAARAIMGPVRRSRSRSSRDDPRPPPHEPVHVDLTALSHADLATLLRNLRSTDRRALVEAVEAELRKRGHAAQGSAFGGPPPLSRPARDEADRPGAARWPSKRQAVLALAALGVGAAVVAITPIFHDRPAPTYGAGAPTPQPRGIATAPTLNTEVQPPPSAAPVAAGGGGAMGRAEAPATVVAPAGRGAVQVATASSDADAVVAQPFLEIARVDPPPPARAAPPAAPPAAEPTRDRPNAPLLTRRAEADLLGSPNPGANPLKGLQSSSPLRMATAITAAAQ